MKNYTAIIAIAIIFIVRLIIFFSRSPYKNNNELIVGMMSGWAPFMIINGAGEYEGFDVDVAQEIAKRMNKTLIVQDLGSLASCFVALDQHKVDMVMSGLDITQKRREALNMIYYTGEDTKQFDLVFWQDIPHGIRSMEDLRAFSDAVVCAESGSAQEKFLDNYDFVTKKRMNSVVDIIIDLRFGKSLVAVIEPRIAVRLKKQNPELQLLPVALPPAFQVFGCGIAIKKSNQQLTDDIAIVVKNMIKDKTIKHLEKKWQLEE